MEIESKHEYSKRARQGLVWMASSTFIWQMISWIITLVTARLLLPEDYGIIAMNDLLYPYLMMVSSLGLTNWIVQREEWNEEIEKTINALLILAGLLSSLVGFFGASLIAVYFREPRAEALFQFGAVMYLIRGFQIIPEARLRRELKFKPIAILNVVLGIMRGLLQVALAFAGLGYWSLVIGTVVRELAYLVCLGSIAGFPKGIAWNKEVVRDSLTYGLTATGASVLWIIFSSADNIIVGRLFGVEVLGFYAMAFYLCDMPLSKLNSIVAPILTPYFSRIRDDINLFRESFLKINAAVVVIVAPTLIGMAIVAPVMIPLLLGDKWNGAVLPLQVLSGVGLLRAITNSGSAVLYALNKPRQVLYWCAVNATLLPIGFYVLGKYMGIYGVYLAWIIIFPLSGVFLMMKILRWNIGIEYRKFLSHFGETAVAILIMVGCCYSVGLAVQDPILTLVLKCAVGVMAYLGSFILLFRTRAKEYWTNLKSLRGA